LTLTGISAPVDVVFPLCCPVEEYEWIDGWKCEMIHCPHDRVEQGCVFNEILSAPFLLGTAKDKTTWTAVLHDPENHRLHFALDNAVSSSIYKIELTDDGKGGTGVRLDFTYRPTCEKGNRIARNNGEGKIRLMLSMISAMLKHYCENGEMLKTVAVSRRVIRSDQLTLPDKIRIAFNKVAMIRMRDKDRKRIIKSWSGKSSRVGPCPTNSRAQRR